MDKLEFFYRANRVALTIARPSVKWQRNASWVSGLFRFGSQGIAATVGVLALLPLAYLVMRALDTDHAILNDVLSLQALAVLGRSLGLMLAVIGGALLIGVPFAWLTSRTDLPYRRVWLALGLVPMVTPTYLIAVTFVFAFGPRGMLQKALAPLGVERLPPIYGLFGAALVLTLCTFPYVVLPLRAALQRTTPLLEEAAADLGANRWQTFWRVIFPQCRPALLSGITLAGLYSLSDFGAAAVMRYDNFTQVIYLQYTNSFDRNRGAVLALMLIVVTLGLLSLQRFTIRSAVHETTGTPSLPSPVKLGRWRYPALAFCGLLIAVSVGTPFGILLQWLTTRNVTRVVEYDGALLVANSIGISIAAAVVCALVAIPLAALMQRSPTQVNRWLGRLPYLGFVLPGIVVGLAMVFFTSRFLPTFYQTLPILLVAYTLRFLPVSLSVTQSAFAQVNPRVEEAAQSLGALGWQVIARITLPLSRSGILAGLVLVFLAVMKELPIALMLAPTGFHTLSYRIWSAYQEAIFSQIGAPGLILMVLSALSVAVILRNEE